MTGILDKLLGDKPASFGRGSSLGKALRRGGVWGGPEYTRIRALPRRPYTPAQRIELTERVSSWLRHPGQTGGRLHDFQALALADLHDIQKGLMIVASVGTGKTLILSLASTVIECRQPLVINHSNLLEKTRRDFDALRKTWRVRDDFKYMSCDKLSRSDQDFHGADLILIDEVHAFKNPRAGRSRRLFEYIRASGAKLVGVTGTPGDEEIVDIAYLSEAALGERSPYPRPHAKSGHGELVQWGEAIDVAPERRLELGALTSFGDTLETARDGVAQWAAGSPGFIVERPVDSVGASLVLDTLVFNDYGPKTEEAFAAARDKWTTPAGREFVEAIDLYRILKTLSVGFYHYLDPDPPREWRAARREWAAFVRHDLGTNRSRRFTPLQVERACASGSVDSGGIYERWVSARATCKPKGKVEFFDDAALLRAAEWLKKEKGLVWCSYPAAAERLAGFAGVGYFGGGGISKTHGSIETYHPPTGGRGAVLSVGANQRGRNLQDRWCRALTLAPGSDPEENEQVIGRLHRQGQKETVQHSFFVGCRENLEAVCKARERTVSKTGKLNTGDWLIEGAGKGRRWT